MSEVHLFQNKSEALTMFTLTSFAKFSNTTTAFISIMYRIESRTRPFLPPVEYDNSVRKIADKR